MFIWMLCSSYIVNVWLIVKSFTDLAFAFFSPFDLLFDFFFWFFDFIGRVIYYHYVLVLVFVVSFYYFNFVWLYSTRKERKTQED